MNRTSFIVRPQSSVNDYNSTLSQTKLLSLGKKQADSEYGAYNYTSIWEYKLGKNLG